MDLSKNQLNVLEMISAEYYSSSELWQKGVSEFDIQYLESEGLIAMHYRLGKWQITMPGNAVLARHFSEKEQTYLNSDVQSQLDAKDAEIAQLRRELEQTQQQSNTLVGRLVDADDAEDALRALLRHTLQVVAPDAELYRQFQASGHGDIHSYMFYEADTRLTEEICNMAIDIEARIYAALAAKEQGSDA